MTVDTAYELAVTPTVQEVARRLWARTKGKGGQTLGTFTADTRPTDVEAEEFITGSVDEVTSSCPTLPESRWGLGKEAVVIRTCMKIELSYLPEQANDSESAGRATGFAVQGGRCRRCLPRRHGAHARHRSRG